MPRKAKSCQRIPVEEVHLWRDEYIKDRNCNKIAKKYNRHYLTVVKHKDDGGWDAFADRIEKRADEIAVEKIAKRRAKALVMVDAALSKMAKDLSRREEIHFTPTELDKLLRLSEYLVGNPDSRPAETPEGAGLNEIVDDITEKHTLEEIEARIAAMEDGGREG